MSALRRLLRLVVAAVRSLGPGWVWFRARHAFALRSGLMRLRSPAFAWRDRPLGTWLRDRTLEGAAAYRAYRLNGAPRFFFGPPDRSRFAPALSAFDGERRPETEASALAAGRWSYFGGRVADVGCPPDWHTNPFTGARVPADRHWSRLDDFAYGDIKVVWEPSRFGFAYTLVRAYWRTGDERWPELFWRLVEDWREHNPPGLGPNWKCGQETSFRIMAWCFGLYGFLASPSSTPDRVAALAVMIAASAARVEQNLAYALHQHNNHGISEGLGLFTVGALFPELRDAARWGSLGRSVLESLGRSLIYDDGSFSQHSANYHRLMLHDYLWVLRLGDVNGAPFSRDLAQRVLQAAHFLRGLQDQGSGRVSALGANDGSLILPLSNAAYDDFRPVVQAAYALLSGTRCFPRGCWDEEVLWLAGPAALELPEAPPVPVAQAAADGGCYVLRGSNGHVLARCARFRHRPGHADQLHVDVWWRGENVTLDAGTLGYNETPPWSHAFEGTASHNTVTVDGLDQMERVSRFLWYPWATGRVRGMSGSGHDRYWEGEHDGYRRLRPPVQHRRAVLRLSDDAWLVADALACTVARRYCLHWLLPDVPHEWDPVLGAVVLHLSEGDYALRIGSSPAVLPSLVRADPGSPRGWRAPRYGIREPALSLALECRAPTVRFWTVFAPSPCRVVADDVSLTMVAATGNVKAQWGHGADDPLVTLSSREPAPAGIA